MISFLVQALTLACGVYIVHRVRPRLKPRRVSESVPAVVPAPVRIAPTVPMNVAGFPEYAGRYLALGVDPKGKRLPGSYEGDDAAEASRKWEAFREENNILGTFTFWDKHHPHGHRGHFARQ